MIALGADGRRLTHPLRDLGNRLTLNSTTRPTIHDVADLAL